MSDYRNTVGSGRRNFQTSVKPNGEEEEEEWDKIVIDPENLFNEVFSAAVGTAVGIAVSRAFTGD
jgi:hypothetical protein